MADNDLVAALLAGDVAALARAVSIVENGRDGFEELLSTLSSRMGDARRIGVTGPPGAGKSTLTEQLVAGFRKTGLRVAVVAVDPTSPFTGGALLGDRIRMESVALDSGVYIRSMATRGSLGGLAISTGEVCDVLAAAGFDRILVETVGVGQSELDVASIVDETILVLVPESGDGIQALKSGVIEAADIIVVNKADRGGAELLRREIELSLDLRSGRRGVSAKGWRPPVELTVATTGAGLDGLMTKLDGHWEWLAGSGTLEARRARRNASRVRGIVERSIIRSIWQNAATTDVLNHGLEQVNNGTLSVYQLGAAVVQSVQTRQ
jgi:LAO/AO transport system kinase